MQTRSVVALLGALLLAVPACDDETAIAPGVETFVATLNGANVRPEPVTTPATGTASFTLLGNLLSWKVDVANISNVSIGHIHEGGPEEPGDVIVDLQVDPTGENFTGTIALDADEVLESVITRLRNGTAYVNIHTNDGVPPTNTGPGDFPGGEIRGQVRRP